MGEVGGAADAAVATPAWAVGGGGGSGGWGVCACPFGRAVVGECGTVFAAAECCAAEAMELRGGEGGRGGAEWWVLMYRRQAYSWVLS